MEPLAKIFGSPARLKVIRLFIFNPGEGFSIAEIAERTKHSKDVVRRELTDLLASGFLRKRGARAATKYSVNPKFEHLPEFDVFIRETTSVSPKRILTVLRKVGTLRVVALTGFFTGVIEPQVDLLVVGDKIDERALLSSVQTLEAELGREIRYASFATPDFRYRLGVYDRLLRDVFDYPHRLLIDKIGI